MPAKSVIAALYLFILAMLVTLLFPVSAHAVNWNSQEVAPVSDTAQFWNDCESLLVDTVTAHPSADVVSWFDWYSIETNAPGSIPFCAVAQVAPFIGPDSPDAPAQEILTLSVRFYRGAPGSIDTVQLLSLIHAAQE